MLIKPAEILTYTIVAASSLLIMSFVVHMLVGGLVSEETEITLIVLICIVDAIVIGFMARDVVRRRRAQSN